MDDLFDDFEPLNLVIDSDDNYKGKIYIGDI